MGAGKMSTVVGELEFQAVYLGSEPHMSEVCS